MYDLLVGFYQNGKPILLSLIHIFSSGLVRRGLVGAVDLEAYDYTVGSVSPILSLIHI